MAEIIVYRTVSGAYLERGRLLTKENDFGLAKDAHGNYIAVQLVQTLYQGLEWQALRAANSDRKKVELLLTSEASMTRYARSFPALDGQVVTEGHAKYCRANGHATHTQDGAVDMFCPRCGDKIDGSDDLTQAQDTTSVALNNDNTEAPAMIKRRENLADMTVKALNALAKDMKLKGYSKLRKAALVEFIATELDRQDEQFLSVENPADAPAIAQIMADTVDAQVDNLYDTLFAAELNEPAVNVWETTDHGYDRKPCVKAEAHAAHNYQGYDNGTVYRHCEGLAKPVQTVAKPVFSSAPVRTPNKAIRTVSKALSAPVEVVAEDTLADLKDAYRFLRTTVNGMGNTASRVKLVERLRGYSAQLARYGVKAQYL